MITLENIEIINQKALGKVCLAQPILNKLKVNSQLANFHDPMLSKLGESRWNGHFVNDTLCDILEIYEARCSMDIYNRESIPKEVKEFVRDAFNYKYRGSN